MNGGGGGGNRWWGGGDPRTGRDCRQGLTEKGRERGGVEVRGGGERWKLGSWRG